MLLHWTVHFFSYRVLNYLLICALGSVQTTQNFVIVIVFFKKKKKSVNRKPFLEQTIFFTHQNFFKSNQTSRKFGGLQSFVRRQNPLLLDSYPTLGHLIPQTWPVIVPWTMTFLVAWKLSSSSGANKGTKTKNW